MNPESSRLKKLLYTLIKVNAFFREAAAEFLCGVYFYELFYFAADFSGEGNNPFANSGGSFVSWGPGEPAARKGNQRAQFKTGLYYFGARYLDTRTGRWIGCDPLGPELANPGREGYSVLEGTNWYGYCSNNPINYSDPTGLFNWDTFEVTEGDTLSEIVSKANEIAGTDYTVNEIAELNGIKNPDLIHPGDWVALPDDVFDAVHPEKTINLDLEE